MPPTHAISQFIPFRGNDSRVRSDRGKGVFFRIFGMKDILILVVALPLFNLVCVSDVFSRPASVGSPAEWPAPAPLRLEGGAFSLQAGALKLEHHPTVFGAFELRVSGKRMAIGQSRSIVGYLQGASVRWCAVHEASGEKVEVREEKGSLAVSASFEDPDGGHWNIDQRFTPSNIPDAIGVETRVQVDRERTVVYLPMLTVFPGAESFGAGKGQGLFAGLEYLADEPSSSEADITGPAANRRVPDSLKITIPLMAIQAGELYVALTWEPHPDFSALFDSPDRIYHSGGHVFGILFPGSNEGNRTDGELLPREGKKLAANTPLVLRATFLGGKGRSVVPAVRQYVHLRGLPPVPATLSLPEYVSLAASGWLDSGIREGKLVRHAVWEGFDPKPAADAACYMSWLAERTTDETLSERLSIAARDAIGAVPPGRYRSASVGHVAMPMAPLVYDNVMANVRSARDEARRLLGRIEPDGRVLYRKKPGSMDFGKTHFAKEANGLTAQVVLRLLDAAVFSGDRVLIDEALRRLRGLDRFRDDVPRGAQTWEVPLHTPDLLAAAHLLRAYLTGFELTGEEEMLAHARYWAWTAVPFIYLVPPTSQPVGLYGTVAVYGATKWKSPIWFGMPVQWCGLVYADGLYRLARLDPTGPWQQLADGITASALQQIWPRTDAKRQGLSPDVYYLKAQLRGGPAINPGTAQAEAARFYRQKPFYGFHAVRERGWLIHVPGEIADLAITPAGARFVAEGWSARGYLVLIQGLKDLPEVHIDGRRTEISPPHRFEEGALILRLQGRREIELTGSDRILLELNAKGQP